jgi:hypothetical protein
MVSQSQTVMRVNACIPESLTAHHFAVPPKCFTPLLSEGVRDALSIDSCKA